jgi:hypothetical protein
MTVHGIFVSAPHRERVYVASRSRKGARHLLWSVMPAAPTAADVRVEASIVPIAIRRAAYRRLGGER